MRHDVQTVDERTAQLVAIQRLHEEAKRAGTSEQPTLVTRHVGDDSAVTPEADSPSAMT